MNERERLHRSEPERSAPIRDFSYLYRRPDGSRCTDGPKIEPHPEDSLSTQGDAPSPQSVEDAYRIIQKHINEGRQRAAKSSHSSSAAYVSDPLQQLMDRMVNLQGELLPLLLDVIRSIAQPSAQSPLRTPSHPPSASADDALKGCSIVLDMVCRRPVEISLELPRYSLDDGALATPGLHALDGNKPALRDVSFAPANDASLMVVRIVIPEKQMSGIYSGVIVNQMTGYVRGTLTAKLKD